MAVRLARNCSLSQCSTMFSRHVKTCIGDSKCILRSDLRSLSLGACWRASSEEINDTMPRPKRSVEEDIKRVKPKQFDLSFEEYLKLKGTLRTRQRIAGLPFAMIGLGTSSVVSAYMFPEMFDATPENVQLIMGLDPLVFCGICGVGSAGVGYAIGTQLFKGIWNIMNKEKSSGLFEREQDFLERIQNKRFASFSKFEDDYYGESIKNLSDYRQWLRTQQKKAAANEKFAQENREKLDQEARTT